MKLIFLFLIMALMQVAASTKAQTITLNKQNISITAVFEEIMMQSDYDFSYSEQQISKVGRINISLTNASINEVLDKCFEGQTLTYSISNNTITIKDIPQPFFKTILKHLSTVIISGTVSDEQGSTLPGATVKLQGSKTTKRTDDKGFFTINSDEESGVLNISYQGYISEQVGYSSNNLGPFNVILKQETNGLEEVDINAGYYTVKDRERTGSISRVTSETIGKQPVNNVLGALIGRMPGVEIKQITGMPGGNYTIQIRGRNSLRPTGNDPFFIVDGVPFYSQSLSSSIGTVVFGAGASPLNYLNPSDIKSIEVLKDADATAIYGSRGANGVVLITTNSGQIGRTSINAKASTGIGMVSNMLDLLNGKQWLEMRTEAFKNDNLIPSTVNAPDLKLWDTTRDTDWQKELIGGKAQFNNVHVSISGGNTFTNFLISNNYSNETTVFPGDFADKKYSSMIRLNHSLPSNKLKVDVLVNYLRDNNKLLATDLTANSVTLSPIAPAIYNADGSLNWENGTWLNPFGILKKKYNSMTDHINANTGLTYEPINDLELKVNVGYNVLRSKEISTSPLSSSRPESPNLASSNFGNNSSSSLILEPQVLYKRLLGRGTIHFQIGATYQESVQDRQLVYGSGFANDILIENLIAAPTVRILNADYTRYRYNAVFGRINYDFAGKYLLNLTARRDGSSRFGPDKQFANFGAIGFAWNFVEEQFIKEALPFLSFGKLRASYGITGSDQIGDYQFLDTYSSTLYPYQTTSGLVPTQLVNPDYAWEKNRKAEFALELSFINNRISINAGVYQNRSSNQLVGLPLPGITGFNSVQYNLPATVQNTGIEVELTSINFRSKSFSWATTGSLTIPRNKLVSFPGLENSVYANTYKVGEPLTIKKKFKSLGVDPSTGIYSFQDVDNNGQLSLTADGQFLKNVASNFYGGLSNVFTFKGFELASFVQFVKQTGYDYRFTISNAPGTRVSNQPVEVLKRWTGIGEETNIQKFTQVAPGVTAYSNAINSSDEVIVDASFIRLKNVSLRWTLPKNLGKHIGLENSSVFVNAQNLLTITNYNGRDPETQISNTLPPLKVFSFGLEISL